METNNSFGQLMDELIGTYVLEEYQQVAMLKLQIIVLKAQKAAMQEMKQHAEAAMTA